MLEVKNINKFFGRRQVLFDVSFAIKRGQIAALLGENGAGKSTLLRIISGYFEASSGDVILNKADLRAERLQALQKIGYVQEVSALYGDMSVFEYLQFAANLRNLPQVEIINRIKEVVMQLELHDVLNQKNETLSKGFKKRVELAAVLLDEPEILLLDEPTEGLDPNQKHSLRQMIKKYAKNRIVIISTHTLEDVEALASEVLLLHKGKLEICTALADFKQTTGNDLLKSFRKITEN